MFSEVFVCPRGGVCLWVGGWGCGGIHTHTTGHTYRHTHTHIHTHTHTHPSGHPPMVNKRAVRILLESLFDHVSGGIQDFPESDSQPNQKSLVGWTPTYYSKLSGKLHEKKKISKGVPKMCLLRSTTADLVNGGGRTRNSDRFVCLY